ncbi:MAG: 4Fe-4S binding protein [Thermoplasmatota archaeon]
MASMARQSLRRGILYVSLALFPITFYYLSPYLIVMGASEGVVSGSFILFSSLFLSSLFLGRLWCAYLCPGGGLQVLLSRIRKGPARGGNLNWIKYMIWIPWIAIIVIMFARAGGISSVDPFYQTWYGISIMASGAVFVMSGVLMLISAVSLIFGRRAFCHYGCWMAPFMIIGSRIKDLLGPPGLRLKANREECIHCKQCTKNCPMSLEVEEMVSSGSMRYDECILCGSCVDICPKKVIVYTFRAGTGK